MTILAAYVPSSAGRAALTFALNEAATRGEDVVVVNASRGDALASDHAMSPDDDARIRTEAERLGVVVGIERVIGAESPASQLLAAADRVSASLIVIGSRGRSTVGKLLMGSAALEILSNARQPVVTVKAEST
ncbi:universal stress protein [Nocardioides cavernae]|uniref:Universal stress protein n=1 Tax=Nocardioides cavernae TaxID=1921566 RepID=A0ABR8NAH6_9ACTN|nr:universal stress protein [Nocardioides cavernae]MBD3924231.1 universal stress protein [Nocardioides cavernae]MBM7510830.1 nucleotide-binding universal stress UspA family protein [Nocardioides cavernae]